MCSLCHTGSFAQDVEQMQNIGGSRLDALLGRMYLDESMACFVLLSETGGNEAPFQPGWLGSGNRQQSRPGRYRLSGLADRT